MNTSGHPIASVDGGDDAQCGLLGAVFIVFCSICRYAMAPVLLIADLPPIDVQRELAAMRAELAEMREGVACAAVARKGERRDAIVKVDQILLWQLPRRLPSVVPG